MDWDGDGVIHGRDVGGCAATCNSTGCSVQTHSKKAHSKKDGLQAAQENEAMAAASEPSACYQIDDFDGDGKQDFVGIYEHTGEQRPGDYNLKLVIVNEDENHNIQHTTFPYSGSSTVENGVVTVQHHVSMQPAGVIDLNPGTITIEQPAVVSYRYGTPKVIYYWQDGELARAFYGIAD
jgi:hypothetical protein